MLSPRSFYLPFPNFPYHEYVSHTHIISLIRRCTTHDERAYVARVCSSNARVYDTHVYGIRVRMHEGVRPCLGLPRVNEYAAVAGWLVKTVALLAYPFLPPSSSSNPSGPPTTLLHVPLATLKPPATLNRRVLSVLPVPRPSARRFFPRFPYLSDIPLPASTRVDVRLIRLKSRREATNYYAS